MANNDLPKDKTKPFTINGVRYANRKEYDERLEKDLHEFALFLYDVYQARKTKEKL